MAATNSILATDLARVREIDFVESFKDDLTKFTEILGVTRKLPKQAGTTLKAYKVSGNLQDGHVGEGNTIPLSKYSQEAVDIGTLQLLKWRKSTTAEAIIDHGYDTAVEETTSKMLSDVRGAIKTNFFTFIATGTGRATGANLQAALAQAWGRLQVAFEDTDVSTVYFINPLDIATYLGAAQITMQTAFGMSYIENFLGLGTVILNSAVPQGTFYATAKDNIVLYYVPVSGANGLGEAFDFVTDQSGLIGVKENCDYTAMTAYTVVTSGVSMFAERIDGVIVGTIAAAE